MKEININFNQLLYNFVMKKKNLLFILTLTILNATEYRVVHLKAGKFLNVREEPVVNRKTLIGRLPARAMGIKIRECKYGANGKEWCYISHGIGRNHLEGWVSRYFLAPMSKESIGSDFYIRNFLESYYKADEENFLDKLKVFYIFPMQQYMTQKGVSRMNLRASKVNFYKQWPRRYYTLGYMKVLKRTEDYIDVRVTVHWKYFNGTQSESGRDVDKLRLIYDDNQFKVLAIKKLQHQVYPKIEEPPSPFIAGVSGEANTTFSASNGTTDIDEVQQVSYYIKAGSFLDQPSSTYLNKITQSGYHYVIDRVEQGDQVIKRVYIGPFSSMDKTLEALDQIRQRINKNAYIQTRR